MVIKNIKNKIFGSCTSVVQTGFKLLQKQSGCSCQVLPEHHGWTGYGPGSGPCLAAPRRTVHTCIVPGADGRSANGTCENKNFISESVLLSR